MARCREGVLSHDRDSRPPRGELPGPNEPVTTVTLASLRIDENPVSPQLTTQTFQMEGMMPLDSAIDPTLTVRETMALHPATRAVFTSFGVDTCCGSGVPIADAARRDGADADTLLDALREVATNS